MKEDFLHYIWQYKKFDLSDLVTTDGQPIILLHQGQYLQQAGPDFFNAQLIISNQKWAGNVEIHIKSSDWYLHHHESDTNYDNVILHVVWEHDAPVFNKNQITIPVLELKKYVSPATLAQYQSLLTPKSWIFCEKQLKEIDSFVVQNWKERLFFERLERKAIAIETILAQTNNDWESVLFTMLAKNFGLNTNGATFQQIAHSIPFAIIRKESFEPENLEALLFGFANLLAPDKEDVYYKDLQFRYYYLIHKYQLTPPIVPPVAFFKHRPDNFPTIRLSQLARLYHQQQNLFSKIIDLHSVDQIRNLLSVAASNYWQTHYQFDKESPKKSRTLSHSFIDLLIINTLVPFQFAYNKSLGKSVSEEIVALMNEIPAEKNAIIDKFTTFGQPSQSAFDSQSLLQLKNEYCVNKKCLSCAIGMSLMKNNN